MKLTVKDIASLVQGQVIGEADRVISGVASLDEATPTDLTFLRDLKDKGSLDAIKTTKAGCILTPKGFTDHGKTFVEVGHPLAALSKVLDLMAAELRPVPTGVHETAVVASSVTLGKNVSIGAYAVIEDHVRIGDGTSIGAHVYVGPRSVIGKDSFFYPQVTLREDTRVGDRCIFHSGCVIGADGFGYFPSSSGHQKIPQIGNVVLEDDVEVGAGATIDRAMMGSTRIGRGTKIDNLVQIAHNVEVGEHSIIVAQVGVGGSAKIGKGVVIGGQAGIKDHCTIGDGAQVGGQSGVNGHIAAKQAVWGTPAIPLVEKIREVILLKKLPELFRKKGLKNS